MTIDMLEFEGESLYFDEPLQEEAEYCLNQAAENYGNEGVEASLLKAYFLEPEHPLVLVALYRYYYYQHSFSDALLVGDRVLSVFAARLRLPDDWHDLNERILGGGVMVSMTLIRFYMLALKGTGYLELRLGYYESALDRLQKVVELDAKDRLGAQALIDVAYEALGAQSCKSSA